MPLPYNSGQNRTVGDAGPYNDPGKSTPLLYEYILREGPCPS